MPETKSVFSKIIDRELPTETIYYEDDRFIAIKDLVPKAPIHVLIIPKEPVQTFHEAAQNHATLLGELMVIAAKVAEQLGLNGKDKGYRIVVNVGEPVQDVYHLHVHLLAGWNSREEADNPSPL